MLRCVCVKQDKNYFKRSNYCFQFHRGVPYTDEPFNLGFDGGTLNRIYPIFICENNRKSNKILHSVDLFFLSGSFEDMGNFSRIYLSICYGSI